MTAAECVRQVRRRVKDLAFDRVSIGYPGDVMHGEPSQEPINLGGKWVGFRFEDAFECPVRVMNDACLQALGSYEGGRMLYMGLGTGVGSAFLIDGKIVPLALGHLAILRGETLHEHLSREGLERRGNRRWQRSVAAAVPILQKAFQADYVVLGGGNAKLVEDIPDWARRGGNRFAFLGGLRLWDDSASLKDTPLSPATAGQEPSDPVIPLPRQCS
jgi:polyphosphate glucokinase